MSPTGPPLLTPDARRTAIRLLDVLQREPIAGGAAGMSRTQVPTIAHTLLRGICEGNPQTEVRHRPLLRWLESRLRDSDPGHAQLRTAPAGWGPAPGTPPSA